MIDDALRVVGGVGGGGHDRGQLVEVGQAETVRIPAQLGGEGVYQVYRARRTFQNAAKGGPSSCQLGVGEHRSLHYVQEGAGGVRTAEQGAGEQGAFMLAGEVVGHGSALHRSRSSDNTKRRCAPSKPYHSISRLLRAEMFAVILGANSAGLYDAP